MKELNQEQKNAVEKIQNGGNFVILGQAGTGKTTLLRHLREIFPDAVVVAPTGNAARLIDGATISSFFRIPPFPYITDSVLEAISSKKVRESIATIKTLIIDEISMVRPDIFAAIDWRLRQYGPDGCGLLPFGGRRIILCGDFFQLGPVITNDTVGGLSVGELLERDLGGFYAFCTPLWGQAKIRPIYLHTNMRQKQDHDFKSCLNAFRSRDPQRRQEALALLNRRVTPEIPEVAIYLCPRKAEADIINSREISRLRTEEKVFHAEIRGYYEKDFPVETEIKLKRGQKIVIAANISDQIVNGTAGIVSDFCQEGISVLLDDGNEVVIGPYAFKRYSYRVVHDPVTGEDRNVPFEVGRFQQLPVLPGYALTIHKAQGMTLKTVALNRGKGCFAHGQCYVGVSRVRHFDDLYLTAPLEISDIIVDPEVLQADVVFRDDQALWRDCVVEKLKKLKPEERDYISVLEDWSSAILKEIVDEYDVRFDAGELVSETETDQRLDFLCWQLFQIHTGQKKDSLNSAFKELLFFLKL